MTVGINGRDCGTRSVDDRRHSNTPYRGPKGAGDRWKHAADMVDLVDGMVNGVDLLQVAT